MFEIVEKASGGTSIKVIGIGGAGGNAVDHMIRQGVQGVDFICANTDAQALTRCLAPVKVQLGKTGLGAGSKPEAGRAAAQESREQIAAALEGAHMCFITAGMGGGTGTGAAPVVAEVAKEMGVLTVAVVTKPFDFENRLRVAESGVEELSRQVDSLIVVLNDKLLEVYGDDAGFEDCFRSADNVLTSAVGGIAEIINVPGLVNVDFQDVRTAMAEMGRAMMGSAEAAGLDRARIAAEQAAVSPLLEGTELSGARCVLVNITASRSLKMSEVRDAVKTVQAFAAPEAFVKYGTVFEENMEDRIRVTVVATGLGAVRAAVARKPEMQVLRTGTDNIGVEVDYGNLELPAVIRRTSRTTVEAMSASGVSTLDIPAFLRKQAD
ncbi:MAG TPA: cell division protein FtsZ [Zoogloea sp.]|uniref:cell division protein FtsZ n=1 Tax=Zoogloea sp. TaxID=49181 RepID=UPI002B76CAAF|nr:cell division protein FtsZ [Zoogloea sp.]HMV16268.1 cell division protein FtsZ [Rhodocyclaceae bacterium]HMV62643.1 cell division protein FtsZ [Rhodocyclaceae bacterium]HMW50716.1 cell division protein FtsZ [Rhodocyclaceae bacterium]HMY48621.1 cell division protein FtsZ [Rhodocyclaceae bacterium]HMZ75354.1 cell division protein FtsZ [Rhodocyclaceae bacterium]